jgi:hypothetical protein
MPQFSDDLFLGNAIAYQGTGIYPNTSIFTASIATTVLTVTAMLSSDPIIVGQFVDSANIAAGTYITAFLTGSGGVGTYSVNASQTAASATTTASGNSFLTNPAPMPNGVGPLGRIYVFDVVPQAAVANNIAVAQTPTTAGALTLAAGSGVKFVTRSDGVSVYQLDCPRAVVVTTGAGSPVTSNFTVSGYDFYGQPMTELIASGAVASTATSGKKAFYQITSITGTTGTVVTITFGTTQILGLPVRVFDGGYLAHVGWNGGFAIDTGTLAVAITTTATNITGDVRGTFNPSTAPDGIKRLVLGILLPAISVGPNATRAGAFGVTQI